MVATPEVSVDCKGMRCPAPILAVSKAAKSATGPATLRITATDGDFPTDLKAWCRSTGHELQTLSNHGGVFEAVVAVGGGRAASPSAAPAATPTASGEPAVPVDCRGLRCPAPILAVAKAVRALEGRSATLRVVADDGDFPTDLRAWARSSGGQIVSLDRGDEGFVAVVAVNPRRAAAAEPAGTVDLRGQPAGRAFLMLGQALLDGGELGVDFVADPALQDGVQRWAAISQASLVALRVVDGALRGTVAVRAADPAATAPEFTVAPAPAADPDAVPRKNLATLLILRNDFESLMAALMVANASAAQGMEVEVFFSFWGVNLLRGETQRQIPGNQLVQVSFLQKMMKWMMPKGPDRQAMSKMNMGGMGLGMMKYFMRQQNILGLKELIAQAVEQDVKFKVCTMSMGIMGITKEDLVDLPNLDFGGVTAFSGSARVSAMSMVF